MTAMTFNQLLKNAQKEVKEMFPWDVEEILENNEELMILDVREPYEYRNMRIKDALNIPRGVLETACEWGYDKTCPELVRARDKKNSGGLSFRKPQLACRPGHAANGLPGCLFS